MSQIVDICSYGKNTQWPVLLLTRRRTESEHGILLIFPGKFRVNHQEDSVGSLQMKGAMPNRIIF